MIQSKLKGLKRISGWMVVGALVLSTMTAFAANPKVLMKTSAGEVVLELYPEQAPKTVANFLEYVKAKQYNGTIFHRVISGFMIQGGGFDKDLKQKATRPPIPNESNNGLKNDKYTIAMARTADPDWATAQFFINVANNDFLNYGGPGRAGYAVFGRVIKGEKVVDAISQVPVKDAGMYQNVPVKQITIEFVVVEK